MTNIQKAFLAIFVGAIIGGATGAVTKIGLQSLPPVPYAFIRFFISSLLILPFIVQKKNVFSHIKFIVPFSLLGSVNVFFYIQGIHLTTATIGQVLYSGVPLLSGIIGFLVYKERLTTNKLIGISIGFLGVLLVILLPVIEKGHPFSGNLQGNLLICIGVVTWSIYMVYSKKALQKYSPFEVTAAFIFVTTLFLLPFFLVDIQKGTQWIHQISTPAILSLAFAIFLNTIFSYLLNQYAIKHGGAIFASMTFYLIPVFAYFFGSLLLGEQLTPGLIVGIALTLFGVFFVTKR